MRSFLALPMPDHCLDALTRVQGTIPTGRPVPEDNLHLTLVFLGDVDQRVLEALDTDLRQMRLPAPEIAFGGLGTFGDMERGLVFAEVLPNDPLSALQAKTVQVARAAGADLPRRRFRPHVTLTRSNRAPRGQERDRLAACLGGPVTVPSFSADTMALYASHLSASGARHEILADYALG